MNACSHSKRTHRKAIFLALCIAAGSLTHTPAGAADYVAMSGPQLYARFCASCHGAQGRGDGPVSGSFAIEVPDLSTLARRQGNTYSRERIERIVDGRHMLTAHGSRTMPVWGEGFSQSELGNPDAELAVRSIVSKLVDFIESLQRPK